MSQPVVAAQLYTVREHTQTLADFTASMRKIRQIGYTSVQVSGTGPLRPADIKAVLDENNLSVCITHIPYDRLLQDLPAVVDEHRLWNCSNVAVGSLPTSFRDSGEAGFRQFAQQASAIGRRLREAGLTFSYHNHSFEFVRFGSRTALDVIFDESDPRYLQAEIDTFWVQHGGGDPAQWIRKMKGRMPVVHLKDMVVLNGQPAMAEVGEGNMNWPTILDACVEAGVRWYAVEQDVCRADPFLSLALSYANLAAMGLK